jgi:hypothetical protein
MIITAAQADAIRGVLTDTAAPALHLDVIQGRPGDLQYDAFTEDGAYIETGVITESGTVRSRIPHQARTVARV